MLPLCLEELSLLYDIALLEDFAFNATSRYLDDILNINNVYFDNIVSQIYPSELQLDKANTSDTEAAFKACICQFLIILFLPKFMINVTILILKLSNSHF